MKKLLSVLLTIILVVSIVPIASLTVSAEDYYTCKVVGGKATITDVDTAISGDVVVPNKWGGFEVVAIGDNAFYECDNITSITLPNSVKSIGANAFGFCDKLENASIPQNITVINDGTFSDCIALKSINLNNVKSIGNYAFANCKSLTDVIIPASVNTLGEGAFSDCDSIVTISLGDNVTSIGKYAFGWCDSLEKVSVGCGITDISEGAFGYCPNLDGVTFYGNILSVGSFAFCDSAIGKIVIPEGVKYIGKSAFEDCTKLNTVIIPNTIETIDSYAFYNCETITDVWYSGSESDSIDIKVYNDCLTNAMWHYGMCKKDEHKYPGDCFMGCTVCGWVPEDHTYTNACDKNCDMCDEVRTVVAHGYNECFIGYEQNEVLYGDWQISVAETGVYLLNADSGFNDEFNAHDISVFDRSGKKVLFYEKIGGWPLAKDLQYTVKFRYNCQDKCDAAIVWGNVSKADTIFADTASEENGGWYNDAVTYAVGAGLITGYGGTDKFGTADNIQRQDFVVILARLAGVELESYQSNRASFTDVPTGAYYEKAIMWAADCGITTGYADGSGKFGVGDNITREQLVTFLYRYAKYQNGGVAPEVDNSAADSAAAYPDFVGVTDYAREAIIWALDKGVISGQGGTHIAPGGNALRCEVAKIIYNTFLNDIF